MSALGYSDIIRELGKNIFIYPISTKTFKNASVDLTASQYAWSTKTKKLVSENGKITFPAHDTVIVFTNETICVSEKICGTYHSRVTLVSKGLSHISTTLDPKFIGISCLSIHNNTDNDVIISVGLPIVTVVFYYIKTPSKETPEEDIESNEFFAFLNGYENSNNLIKMTSKNKWVFHKKPLKKELINSEEFQKQKSILKRHRLSLPPTITNNLLPIIISIISSTAILIILCYIEVLNVITSILMWLFNLLNLCVTFLLNKNK